MRWRRAGAVVALESTIISHGLPRPDNLQVAREIEARGARRRVRCRRPSRWSTASVRVGLDDGALETIARSR